MKKAIFFLAVLLLTATVVFAGGQQEGAGAEVITLSLYEYSDLVDETDVKNTKILFDTFYAGHPNIKLDIEYGFDEPYHDKLQAMLVADQLADVMFLWPGKRTGTITGSGKIKDLRPWLKGHEVLRRSGVCERLEGDR